ncbi:hypothetical protein RZE82_08730 [Mollicutes bacterium LVI A0039]|nr:hypothetical protein RZE82_08730 [Mollicutes bacterium LVI A0039]
MKKKIIIGVVLLMCLGGVYFSISNNILDDSKYVITYQLPGGYAYSLPVDEEYVVGSRPVKSKLEMTNRKYSFYSQGNVTSTRMIGKNLYLNCIEDVCKDNQSVLHEQSYSQKLFLTRLGNFDIRMYPTEDDFATEILNIDTDQVIAYEGSSSFPGTTLKDSILIERANGINIEWVEINPKDMTIKRVISLRDITNSEADFYRPVSVDGELYFYYQEDEMLKTLDADTLTLSDSQISNPLPILKGDSEEVYVTEMSDNDKSYYIVEFGFDDIYITDFEKAVKLDSTGKEFYGVYDNIYDDEIDKFLLLTLHQDAEDQVVTFVSFDPNTFEVTSLSDQPIDENMAIMPTISKNY